VSLLGASVFIGLLLLVLGLSVGSAGWYSPWALLDLDALPWDIVWQMRAPRAVGAALVGALLGLSGAIAQGLFRNPLAEPYLLGSSSGAALALALALACGLSGALVSGESGAWGGWWNRMGWTGAAFVGAVGGVALTLLLARGAAHTMRLLLAGVVVGVVLGAITQLLMLWSSPVWRAMQSFMLGSTALLGWQACGVMCAALVVALPMALMLSRVLDALSLGESTAQTLGVPLGWPRLCLVGVMTLATAVVVAQVGLIAFVGLAAPHLVRRWSGAQHVRLLCLATSMGALLLMAADTVARIVLAPQELPVGVVTAVLGGGYLLFLLWRKGVGP
jgi:iron complex transport system permease protein